MLQPVLAGWWDAHKEILQSFLLVVSLVDPFGPLAKLLCLRVGNHEHENLLKDSNVHFLETPNCAVWAHRGYVFALGLKNDNTKGKSNTNPYDNHRNKH